jgi:hypothetical protein
MKTAEQRKTEFLQDLRQLCFKHSCELSISDDGKPYGMHSPILVLAFDGVYSEDNETLLEFGCFELDNVWLPSKTTVTE